MPTLNKLKGAFTHSIKQDALRAGWPEDVVKSLKVIVDGDTIKVSYPDKYAKIIEDLEYGTENSSPQPILRSFLDKNAQQISNHLLESSIDDLISQGVIP